MKILKVLFSLGVVLLLADVATALDWVGKITESQGQVSIIRSGQTLARLGSGGVLPGDEIVTGPSSRAKIWFKDNSQITLSEKSRFKVDALEYNEGVNRKSVFTLVSGKARALVGGWFSPTTPELQYQIHALSTTAGVRGTEFTVEIQVLGQTKVVYVEVFSGNVRFWTAENPQQVINIPADSNFQVREGENAQQAQERQQQYAQQLAQEIFGNSGRGGGMGGSTEGGGSNPPPQPASPANRTEQ